MVFRTLIGRWFRYRRRSLVALSCNRTVKCGLLILLLFSTLITIWYQTLQSLNKSEERLNLHSNVTTRWRQQTKHQHIHPAVQKGEQTFTGPNLFEQYCNDPRNATVHGNEGQSPDGFTLRMVFILIRHGDRSPLHNIPGYTPPKINCDFESWYTGNDKAYKQFPVRMRTNQVQNNYHFSNWSPVPNKLTCAIGSLTGRGALQHLMLGRHFSQAYASLLNSKKTFKNQIKVTCTGTPRTYQSVSALLYSFLPYYSLSDVDYKYASSIYFCDHDVWSRNMCFCKGAEVFRRKIKVYERMIELRSQSASVLSEKLKSLFKADISKLGGMSSVADALAPGFCHNLQNSHLTSDRNFTIDRKLIDEVWTEMTQVMYQHWNDTDKNREKFSSVNLYPLLTEIYQGIKHFIDGQHSTKVWIYSGHDSTLTALLFVLGLNDGIWPPYASRVNLELYESEAGSTSNRFYMKILYNGRDVTNDVNFCKHSTQFGLCDLKYFNEFVSNTMLLRYGYNNFTAACESF
ncbi:2-phosphoxylose phosphatase 1 [Mactra antiquata]